MALDAIDSLPARIDTAYLLGATKGGPFDVANFRRREWLPALEAAGIARPVRLYDLGSTLASNALAAGITVHELARIMGTSVGMIEAHYGALTDTARDSLLERLEAAQQPSRSDWAPRSTEPSHSDAPSWPSRSPSSTDG